MLHRTTFNLMLLTISTLLLHFVVSAVPASIDMPLVAFVLKSIYFAAAGGETVTDVQCKVVYQHVVSFLIGKYVCVACSLHVSIRLH